MANNSLLLSPTTSMVVSLGPTSMASYKGLPKNPLTNGTGLNKRCLRRDVNKNAALGATADRMFTLMQSKDVDTFYNTLLGQPPPRNDPYPWGVCPLRTRPELPKT